ncbi:MAG: glycoside hydrolase family 3 protein [Selenomonadaceae bacterium]|nr:glycoside hydrolase family 3 protein [Selenomonadaceae bacterium]
MKKFVNASACVPSCLIFILALSLLLMGCGSSQKDAAQPPKPTVPKNASLDEKVDAMVSSMTLKEKIGQMVMIGIHGTDVTEDSLFMLHQYHIGGIILFDRNMESQEQVKKLNAHLQKEAQEKLPLFIGVDEEGGIVSRMKDALPPPPSEKEIGETGDPENARTWAAKTAAALKGIGFNMNFAPAADLGLEPGRSYSSDPAVVTEFVGEAAKGYEQEHLIYCLKHFPGLGKSTVDTHNDASIVNASRSELQEEDLLPFRTLIAEKNPEDYFILVSHAIYPALGDELPASTSPSIQTGLLRHELGYNGVIITDDIAMGAVSKTYTPGELAVKAVEAGTDIVLTCHEYQNGTEVYLKLLEAVEKGILTEDRINESVKRIVRVKLTHLAETN